MVTKTFKDKLIIMLIASAISAVISFLSARASINNTINFEKDKTLSKKADIEYVDKQDKALDDKIKEVKVDIKDDLKRLENTNIRIENKIDELLLKLNGR